MFELWFRLCACQVALLLCFSLPRRSNRCGEESLISGCEFEVKKLEGQARAILLKLVLNHSMVTVSE